MKRQRDPKNGLSIAAQPTLFPAENFPHPDTEICLLHLFVFLFFPDLHPLLPRLPLKLCAPLLQLLLTALLGFKTRMKVDSFEHFLFCFFTSFIYRLMAKSLHVFAGSYFQAILRFSQVCGTVHVLGQ